MYQASDTFLFTSRGPCGVWYHHGGFFMNFSSLNGESPQAIVRSRTPEPPYCWQSKEALRKIERTYDSESRTRLASCAYFALTRIASDKESESFECSIREISHYMHYSYKEALEGIKLAEIAGVIRVERRLMLGTKENAPSIYTLLQVVENSHKAMWSRQNKSTESIEVTEKQQRSLKTSKDDIIAVTSDDASPPLSFDPEWKPNSLSKEEKLRRVRVPNDYPSEPEFDEFLEEDDMILPEYRPDLYSVLCRDKWHEWREDLRKWVKIRDWRRYVSALNESMMSR